MRKGGASANKCFFCGVDFNAGRAGIGCSMPGIESSEASGNRQPPSGKWRNAQNPLKFQAEHGFARLRKFDLLVQKTVELAEMAS